MNTYLTEFPEVLPHPHAWDKYVPREGVVTGDNMWREALHSIAVDLSIREVDWIESGETAGFAKMKFFLENFLDRYNDQR